MSVQISKLASGIHLITDAVPEVETVSVGIWSGVGSRHEEKSINGIAHFLEHMAFKGTATRNAKQIAEAIEDVGGYLNASTGREQTSYYAKVMKEDGQLALDILSDILQAPTFDEAELERERGVILQEIGQTNDTPDDIIFDHFQEVAYPDQAMGRPILGHEEIIRKLQPNDFRGFLSRYRSDDMVIAAAGNLDHQEWVAMAESMIKPFAGKDRGEMQAMTYQGGESRVVKELDQVHVVLGFPSISYLDPKYYAAQLYSTMLGEGMSSRLFQEIREKRGLVYSIYSYLMPYQDAGTFGIYAGTGEKEVAELLPVVVEEMKKTDWLEPELQRAKAQMKSSFFMSQENMFSRAELLAQHWMIHGKMFSKEEMLAKINAITLQDITDFGQNLIRQKPSLASVGPIDNVLSLAKVADKLA